MSIAYEINRLNRNKQKVKEQVNVDKDIISEGREFIRDETVNHYSSGIKSMEMSYKDFIPVHTSTESLIETERGGTIISKTLKGNTSQNGTPTPSSPVPVNNVTGEQIVRVCGKNLLDISNMEIGTKNGITISKDNYENITISGTATSYTAFNIPCNLSGENTYSCNNWESFTLYMQYNGHGISGGSASTNKTYNGNVDNLVIGINKDVTINKTIRIQVEKGSTATTYEEYQGKDYEINLGKNLLDETTLRQGSGYDPTITNRVFFPSNYYLEPGTYTCYTNLNTTNYKYAVGIATKAYPNPVSYVHDSGWQTLDHVTFTLSQSGYLGVGVAKSDGTSSITPSDISNYHFMLYKGSYDSTITYAPYFEPIELNKIGDYQDFIRKGTGKNLLNTNKMLYGTISQTDGITISDNSSVLYSPQYIEVKPNTKYTLSCKVSNITIRLFNYENDNTYINTSIASTSNMTTSFTTSSNTYFIRLQYNQSFNVDMQLEEGSFTYYEPYNYGDKWYIEKNTLKLVVPNAVIGTLQNSNKRFYVNGMELGTSNILKNTQSSKTYGLYCDILGEVTAGQTWGGTQGISYDYNSGQNRGCLDFAINGLTTVEEYQNALKGKAIYVIANTPEYTLIENKDLIEQLEKIMPLLEGQNNISVSGNLPTGIDVDYIERVNKHLIGNTNESAE